MSTQNTTTEGLTPKQEKAIGALLMWPTMAEAARAVGVAEYTITRWQKIPAFQEAYRDARRMAVSLSITQAQKATGEAVQTLRDVMADTDAAPGARVSAAKCVLDTAIKAVELEDLQARVDALEGALGGKV